MAKTDTEILLPTAFSAFWRCLALSGLFALTPMAILVLGEIATGKPSPYHWLWFVVPAGFAALIVWVNRPGIQTDEQLKIVDFSLRSSRLPGREIPLAGIQRVDLRRGLINCLFGLRTIRIGYSGKLRHEITGLSPEHAKRALAFIDGWRLRSSGRGLPGRLITPQELQMIMADGDWRQIYTASTGLRAFEIVHALCIFALAGICIPAAVIAVIGGLHSPRIPSFETVRKAYWGYVILLPGLVLAPVILWSMWIYGWRHMVDLFTPAVTYHGFLERKYSGQSTRMQLHFIGSGPWDWQLPGSREHKSLALQDEILVRFHRRSQVATAIFTRSKGARRI